MSTLERTSSLAMMWETCVSTVRRDTKSSAAMSGLDRPVATKPGDRQFGSAQCFPTRYRSWAAPAYTPAQTDRAQSGVRRRMSQAASSRV